MSQEVVLKDPACKARSLLLSSFHPRESLVQSIWEVRGKDSSLQRGEDMGTKEQQVHMVPGRREGPADDTVGKAFHRGWEPGQVWVFRG